MSIMHTEYISDVWGGPTAVTQDYVVNPQDSTTFTWLSAIASRFEYYKFHKLKLHYRPSCSTANPGFVLIGMDFDFYDKQPSKATMLAWKFAKKSAVYDSITVDCTSGLPQAGWKYCESLFTSGDQRVNNLGKIWIITDNCSTGLNLGEIFIEYEVSFKQPAIKSPPSLYGAVTYDPAINPNAFVDPASTNIRIEIPNAFNYVLRTAGRYLLQLDAVRSTSVSDIFLTFTTPTDYPQTEYQDFLVKKIVDGAQAGVALYVLDLLSGAISVGINVPGSGPQQHVLRFATYLAASSIL